MNKKLIAFICILSLLVPFLPQFDFVVRADSLPSASEDFAQWIDDNFYESDYGVLRPKSQAPLYMKVNWALTDAGYVLKDPVSCVVDSLQSATNLQLLTKQNLMDYGQSINYDYSTLSNNVVYNSISYAQEYVPYYIFRTMTCTEFLNMIPFTLSSIGIERNYGYQEAYSKLQIINTKLNSDSVCLFRLNGNTFFSATANYNAILKDDFLNNFMYCLNLSDFVPTDSKQYYTDGITPLNNYLPVGVWWCDGQSSLSSLTFDKLNNTTASYTVNNTIFSNYAFADPYNLLNGSVVLVPDSAQNFDYICFKSLQECLLFGDGESPVYHFNSDLNIPEGADIDYSRLYDIISTEVSHSSGNVINTINGVANNYLQQQLELLHDINNALNDGNGQSWLRRIYGLLDYNFPLTLQAFEDLDQAIQNISISGGGSDLTHINRVLDEINDKLGFMIEEPLTNADIEDMNDLKNLASQKFPFCVFSDIVAISVILNQTPEQPHWQIPLKLPGSESVNNIEVDLSWYEDVRGLVQGVFIFIFIVGLLALSVKVFSALKS